MKKPKVEKINLPYASSVASFYGDQGAAQGSSFLGKMFKGGGRTIVTQTQPGGSSNITSRVRGPQGRNY